MVRESRNCEQTESSTFLESLPLFSKIDKIVSGGQTGVDRAALDVAIELNIPHGGWCPRGRRSECGRIPDRYQLGETESADYSVRTERNIVESNGTLILHFGPLKGGTRLTWNLANNYGKPVMKIDLQVARSGIVIAGIRDWITQHNIRVLNVAGPRESSVEGIGGLASELLVSLFSTDLKEETHRGQDDLAGRD